MQFYAFFMQYLRKYLLSKTSKLFRGTSANEPYILDFVVARLENETKILNKDLPIHEL